MVKLRLTRMGSKKAPFYRIVAIDSRKARDAQYLDKIGYYDPTKEPAIVNIDSEKALAWLAKGAQPTDTVRSILKQQEIIK
ncbi:MAG: 30S ribosomal protein S16 [Clostridia bacterium]|nr:30S ribosomal protein S16 [Clostridia bacterium]MDE6550802.1 30S ribosomal protein S16 [Clostridia bacterium]